MPRRGVALWRQVVDASRGEEVETTSQKGGRPRQGTYSALCHTPVQVELTVEHVWGVDLQNESFRVELQAVCKWLCPKEHADEAMRERLQLPW